MVYEPTRTVDVEGDRVYSEIHSADSWWETQDRHPPGATIVPLICGSNETQLMDFLRRQESRADLSDHWEHTFLYTEQIQLPRANCAYLPPGATQIPTQFRIG
jgi:hypothetical protein